jgi:hypothetical protein
MDPWTEERYADAYYRLIDLYNEEKLADVVDTA